MSVSVKNPAVRRIMNELQEFERDTLAYGKYHIEASEDNIFELHFTIRGPPDSPFAEGRYHGRIICPAEYPYKPPEIMFSTPNGRFEINTKVCLSVSSFHPESWQPAWGIRTVLVGLVGFMATESESAIGSVKWTEQERRQLASRSNQWQCPTCAKTNLELLSNTTVNSPSDKKPQMPNNVVIPISPTTTIVSPLSPECETTLETSTVYQQPNASTPEPHSSSHANNSIVHEPTTAMSSTENLNIVAATSEQEGSRHIRTSRQQIDMLIMAILVVISALLFKKLM